MSDLISRRDAIETVVCHIWHMPNEAYRQFNCENIVREVVEDAIQRLPSAEQATCKLKNPCDSLLTDDSGVRKEQKSKLDLISRQGVVTVIDGWIQCCTEEDEDAGIKSVLSLLKERIEHIKSLPSAEQKTGEWKVKREHNRWMRKCSVCGWMQEIDTPKMQGWYYSYCPNCGADMRGEDDEYNIMRNKPMRT